MNENVFVGVLEGFCAFRAQKCASEKCSARVKTTSARLLGPPIIVYVGFIIHLNKNGSYQADRP